MSNLRKETAIALGDIGDARAIKPLEGAMNDPDPDVRKIARLALARINPAS
jgi:HEAT repeat protein